MDFFVVGTSRTGSTLVRRMLAAHPAVVVLNESHWVPLMWHTFGASVVPLDALIAIVADTRWDSGRRVVDVNLELAGGSWDELVERLRARLGVSSSVAAFHGAIVDEIFGPAPVDVRRGDKTPDYGFHMSTLAEIWPQARFVHVVRNGVDTARSMARHSGCQLMISAGYDNWVPLSYGRAYEAFERLDLPLDAYVGSWERRMARIRSEAARLRPGTYVEVRYETLIDEPAVVMEEVATHLGLESPDAWLTTAAGLVRPSPTASRATDVLRCLSVDHLRALNDVGGVSYLAFPPDACVDQIETALGESQDGGDAVRVALGALATRTIDSRPALVQRAMGLLRDALVATGEDLTTWTILRSGRMSVTPPPGDELHRLGPERAAVRPDAILVFACVRNESLRLPYFLDYYRRLAVTRFIVVDNDSSDGTTAFLLSQADVDVYHTARSYAGSHYGVHWLNCLLREFGSGHWVLVVDADELLVYPECETVSLPQFVSTLEASRADALLTFLLDMYPEGAIEDTPYEPGAPFLAASPYFDVNSYTFGSEGLRARVPERGGPRQRIFWHAGREYRGKPPYLQKIPLVKWRSDLQYLASTHLIDGLHLASATGVLLHFKFFADFAHRSRIEMERGEHWDNAAQYEAYVEAMSANPRIGAIYEGSVRYRGSRQLIELGLMLE